MRKKKQQSTNNLSRLSKYNQGHLKIAHDENKAHCKNLYARIMCERMYNYFQ